MNVPSRSYCNILQHKYSEQTQGPKWAECKKWRIGIEKYGNKSKQHLWHESRQCGDGFRILACIMNSEKYFIAIGGQWRKIGILWISASLPFYCDELLSQNRDNEMTISVTLNSVERLALINKQHFFFVWIRFYLCSQSNGNFLSLWTDKRFWNCWCQSCAFVIWHNVFFLNIQQYKCMNYWLMHQLSD